MQFNIIIKKPAESIVQQDLPETVDLLDYNFILYTTKSSVNRNSDKPPIKS